MTDWLTPADTASLRWIESYMAEYARVLRQGGHFSEAEIKRIIHEKIDDLSYAEPVNRRSD